MLEHRDAREHQLARAHRDTREDTENLLLVGFGFEATHKTERQGRIVVHRVQAHQDLRIGELAPDPKADTLVLVAEPDIEVEEVEKGKWALEVKGFDSYNPATGQVTPMKECRRSSAS